MVSGPQDPTLLISRLEARIEALEKHLRERSELMRALASELCTEDLISLSRLAMGLSPASRAGIGLAGWRETTALTSGDVDRTMKALWRSLSPRGQDNGE